ncbi:unnamed protein product, partial [Owenia fusiformis]
MCGNPTKGHLGPYGPSCTIKETNENMNFHTKEEVEHTQVTQPPWMNAILEMGKQIAELTVVTSKIQKDQDEMRTFMLQNISKPVQTLPLLPEQPPLPSNVHTGDINLQVSHEGCKVGVPPKISKSIVNGEYVNMTELLPTNLYNQYIDVQGNEQIICSDNGELKLAKKHKQTHIQSFMTWMTAWNIYELIVMEKHPGVYNE